MRNAENIENVKVEEIRPYANNPRKNDDAVIKVMASIQRFGFKVPIVLDNKENKEIVCGHTRWKAAKKLNMETVPCLFAEDLSEEEIRAFRLADNKVAEFATWDMEMLELELDSLGELEMSEFGFESFDDEEKEQNDSEEEMFDDIDKLETYYGVPYQGNKSRIADIIINLLPEGNRLVDLFGGGGAITHCAMLSGRWNSYLYNDINSMITTLFMDAVRGKYHDENRVITREDFERLKDEDPYIKYIWSFGNNGTTYLWGKDIEEIKCQACRIIMEQERNDRRLAYVKWVRLLKDQQQRVSINRLQSIEHLQALNRLEVTNLSYEEFEFKEGDVVYCDVPYERLDKNGCSDYEVEFDSLRFYEWVKSKDYQVFFSSYEISDDSFYKLKIKSVQSLIGTNTNGKKVNEYLYSNRPIELNSRE